MNKPYTVKGAAQPESDIEFYMFDCLKKKIEKDMLFVYE